MLSILHQGLEKSCLFRVYISWISFGYVSKHPVINKIICITKGNAIVVNLLNSPEES